MLKVAVFTARIGSSCDDLRDPAYVAPGARYYCASDRPVTSAVWQRIEVAAPEDPVTAARDIKISPPRELAWADYHLWIDARYRLEVTPEIFAPLLMSADILVFGHPFCPTLRDEAEEIRKRDLAPESALNRQLAEYRAAGFPMVSPHSSTGFLVRRNDPRTAGFNQVWSEQLRKHGHPRDQMSFDFAAWRSGLRVRHLEGHYRENPYATWGEDG